MAIRGCEITKRGTRDLDKIGKKRAPLIITSTSQPEGQPTYNAAAIWEYNALDFHPIQVKHSRIQ